MAKVLADHTFDHDTVLIGHSGGAALLLALLERVDVTVAQAMLVAGYSTPPGTSDEPVLQSDYDWTVIRSHVRDLYFINSPNDPYGCDDRQGRAMFDQLGGTQVIRHDGHFGDHDRRIRPSSCWTNSSTEPHPSSGRFVATHTGVAGPAAPPP